MEKILVIDDDPNLIKQMIDLLMEFNYNPHILLEPEYLFQKLELEPIDIIFMDVNMPGVDGIDLLSRLKSHKVFKKIPVIMLTGETEGDVLIKCFKSGAIDFISKPITKFILKSRLKSIVQGLRKEKKIIKTLSVLKKMNNTLEEQKNQLISAEKLASLGVLTAGIYHEINNPNNFVFISSNEIKEKLKEILHLTSFLDEEVREHDFIKHIESEIKDVVTLSDSIIYGSKRIQQVVKAFSSFLHMEYTDKKLINVSKLIDDAQSVLSYAVGESIEITKDYSQTLDYNCDSNAMTQVFMHILKNSVQSLNNNGEVIIRTEMNSKGLKIEFKDNGCGISEKDLAKVFDPFFTTRKVGEGLGMGLAISNAIIDAHGGNILIDSKINKGTTVFITLPYDYCEFNLNEQTIDE